MQEAVKISDLIRTNVPGLYRNVRSGVIINKNIGDLNAFNSEKNRIEENKRITKTVEDLTNTVEELKSLVTLMTGNLNAI